MQEQKLLTLSALRKAARELGYLGRDIKVTIPLDFEADARDLPSFKPVEDYNSVQILVRRLAISDADAVLKPLYDLEIGRIERFVIVLGDQDYVTVEAAGECLTLKDLTPSPLY